MVLARCGAEMGKYPQPSVRGLVGRFHAMAPCPCNPCDKLLEIMGGLPPMSCCNQKLSCRWRRAGPRGARLQCFRLPSTQAPCMTLAHLYLFIAIVAEVVATSFLKSSDSFSKLWPSVITVVGYAIAFLFLSLTLRTMPTGIAYAIWSGTGIVLISLVSWWWFGQSLDLPAIAGMGLIIAGVVVVNVFSKTAGH